MARRSARRANRADEARRARRAAGAAAGEGGDIATLLRSGPPALLLALGLWALAEGSLSEAPFNPGARIVGPNGRAFWGPDFTTMMNAADYRMAAGAAWLRAADDRVGPARLDAYRRAVALDAAAAALRPTDPFARLDLALARLALGEHAGALDALRASQERAPLNPWLAVARVELGWRLRAVGGEPLFALVAADLRIVRAARPAEFNRLLRLDRRLKLFAEQRLGASAE